MSFSLGLGGSRSSNTNRQTIDANSAQYIRDQEAAARRAGASGPSPLLTGASDYYTRTMGAGQTGMDALAGNPAAAGLLMNPYQQQVIDATNKQWDRNDQMTTNNVNDMATKAGAFGGSRHGVAEGVALGENNMNRNNAVSGLLYGGFNDAMGRAGQLAGMGMNAAGQNANLGFGGVGSPDQWLMQMMKSGYGGPTQTWGQSTGTQFGGQIAGKFG